MASCNTFPTATNTVEVTTETLSTTVSLSVTTEPPTVITTTTTRPCPTTVTSGTCIPSTITTVISSPGTTRTVTVPVTVPVPITQTQINTLYGSSCSNPPDNPPTPPPNTPSTTPTPTFTPTPTTYTSTSAITSNGSTIISTIVVTSTQSPGPSNTVVAPPNNNKTSPGIGPIVGGVVGGFFGLIAIVALIWFLLKRRRRWDDIWDEDKDVVAPGGGPRFSIDTNTEPKPYEYGLVGTALAPQPASPPHSPPLGPTLPAVTGVLHPTHGRTPSMAPLLSTTNSHSSRPSTGGSTHPLQGFVPQPIPGQRRPSIENTGRPPSNGHTFTTISHTPSTMSNMTYPPAPMSVSNFSGTASNAGSSDLGRSGSPTSFAEPQRILQIANPHPASPGNDNFRFSDPFSSSSAAAAAAASSSFSEPQRDGKGRIRRPSLTKAPIVHLDGGRVQQQLEAATAGAGSSIPQQQPQQHQHQPQPQPMPMQVGGGDPGPAPPAYEA